MPHSRVWPVLLLVTGLAWAAAAALLVRALLQPWPSGGAAIALTAAGVVAAVAPALAIILLAAAALRGEAPDNDLAELEARTAAAGAAAGAVRETLLDVDATLAAIHGRIDALTRASDQALPQLTAASRQLGDAATGLAQSGTAVAKAAGDVETVLPTAQRQAELVAATLAASGSEATRQLEAVETMLAGVQVRHDAATAEVVAIEHHATRAAALLDHHAATLGRTVDTATAHSAAAMAAVADGLAAHEATMRAAIDTARNGLDTANGPLAGSVARQVEAITAATAALTARLDDSDTRTAAMIATIERSFAVLDKRLAHAAAMGTATLDALHGRMEAVRGLADTLHPPLDAANTTLALAAASVARLQPAAAAAADLARTLREAELPATALADTIERAHASLTAVEAAAHGTTLAATQQLIDLLARARDSGTVAAGHVGEALQRVIAEAETELAAVGGRVALSGFTDPVRHEIAGLEGAVTIAADAAQATADRIAARLLGLTATVATVERRLAERVD